MATEAVIPMLETAPTAAETPTPDTTTETPTVETAADSATTEDGKPDTGKLTTEKATESVPITNAKVVETLKAMNANPKTAEMAKHLFNEVKYSQDAKRLMRELAPEAKNIEEAKQIIASRVDPDVQSTVDAVNTTDELLYRGDLKELSNNILEDVTAELGNAAPARLGELADSLYENLKESAPQIAVQHQRSQFLDASESSGLINSLNTLHGHIVAGRQADAKQLLSNIGKFFSDEMSANEGAAKARTDAQAAAEESSSAAVQTLKAEASKSASRTANKTLGSYLSPFLQKELKGLSRPELDNLAGAIYKECQATLGRDTAYAKDMDDKYKAMKSPRQRDVLLKAYEAKVKGIGQKVVTDTAKRMFPDRFVVKPAAPKAPSSTKVTIGGSSQTVFQVDKKPSDLVRQDTQVGTRLFTVKDLEMLEISKGYGLVKTKTGTAFVCWRKK